MNDRNDAQVPRRREQPRRVRLTDRTIRALKPPDQAEAQREYWDEGVHGFGVRVGYGGARSFVALFRVGGKKVRMTLGRYEKPGDLAVARDKAIDAIRAARQGQDPSAPARVQRSAPTVAELAGRYLEEYAKPHKARSWKNDAGHLRVIKEKFGAKRIAALTRAEIKTALKAIAAETPTHANRIHETLRRMLNWAIAEEMPGVTTNPAGGIGKFAEEVERDRVLKDDEIRALWDALEAERQPVRGAFRLMLLTGQRELEVLHMAAEELEGNWWTLPGRRAKNKHANRVFLAAAAQEIVTAAVEEGREFVFRRPGDPAQPFSRSVLLKRWAVIRERAKLTDVRPHDLRRTAATQMARLGVDRLIISKLLNHVDRTITGTRYELDEHDEERRDALTKWEARLLEIVRGPEEPSNVVPLARTA